MSNIISRCPYLLRLTTALKSSHQFEFKGRRAWLHPKTVTRSATMLRADAKVTCDDDIIVYSRCPGDRTMDGLCFDRCSEVRWASDHPSPSPGGGQVREMSSRCDRVVTLLMHLGGRGVCGGGVRWGTGRQSVALESIVALRASVACRRILCEVLGRPTRRFSDSHDTPQRLLLLPLLLPSPNLRATLCPLLASLLSPLPPPPRPIRRNDDAAAEVPMRHHGTELGQWCC